MGKPIKSLLSLVDNPLQDYGVPPRFSGGVRGGMRKTVGDAATDRIGRYRDLSRQYQSASGSNQKNEVVDFVKRWDYLLVYLLELMY